MLAKVHSGAVYGIDAYPVEIEACPAKLQRGWVNEGRDNVPSPRLWNTGPQTVIVGLPGMRMKSYDGSINNDRSSGLGWNGIWR